MGYCLRPDAPVASRVTSGSGTERTNLAGLTTLVVGGRAEVAFRGRQDRC